jgi:hypothetical protein
MSSVSKTHYIKKTSCKLVRSHQRFEGVCCFHFQGTIIFYDWEWRHQFSPQRLYLLTNIQGWTNVPKRYEPPQTSRRQKDDMKQVTYWGTINNRRHWTELSRPGFTHPCIYIYIYGVMSKHTNSLATPLREARFPWLPSPYPFSVRLNQIVTSKLEAARVSETENRLKTIIWRKAAF